jgi:hypothetical protein
MVDRTYCLVSLLLVAETVFGIVFDGSAEQSVDEGCLSETALANDHNSEGSTPLCNNLVTLVGQIGNANCVIDVSGRHGGGRLRIA